MTGAEASSGARGDLRGEIAGRIGGFSPQIQRVAQFCLQHGDEVAFLTVRELADHAGASPASVMRLARELGFSGFLDFRDAFRKRVRGGVSGLRSTRPAQEDIAERADELLVEKLDALFTREFAARARRVASLLVGADRVHVAGFRSAHAFAHYFSYLGQMAFSHFELVGQNETALFDALARSRGRAVAVIFSFAPYAIEAVRFADLVADEGLQVVAITDTMASPLARRATEVIEVPGGKLRHFSTLTPCMAACEVLLEYCIEVAGDSAAAEITGFERKVRQMQGYW